MKILFCAYDKPNHTATGPNAWLQRLVPNLINAYGLKVTTLFFYKDDEKNCPTLSYFKAQQLPYFSINTTEVPFVEDQLKALLKIVKQDSSSVLVANLVIPALYATRYLQRAHIPVIGVLHSHDPFYKGVIQKFINGPKEDQLTAAVAVSEYIGTLAQSQETVTRLAVIPCGTPTPTVKAEWENLSELKVMYAGRIVLEAKQILKLTQAFLEASDLEPRLQFSIYGDGDEVDQVQELLREQHEDKVIYNGAVSPSEIIACFQEHQVFTMMSDYEGMPVALMEAMACGVVPVCLEEASGVNEIIEHGVNGFIVKDRHQDYQRHLQLLLDDPELWQQLSNNAIKTVKARYSSAKTHQQWFQLLNSYSGQQATSLKTPRYIKLEGELLHYGDNRKPDLKTQWHNSLKRQWLQLRLFMRPRARIRAFFNK